MDPQKFSGENSGPGDIPTALQLEMMMTLSSAADHRQPCRWQGCTRRALWIVTLVPVCETAHAQPACQQHAEMVESIFARAAVDSSLRTMCRYCLMGKTGCKKEPIRNVVS